MKPDNLFTRFWVQTAFFFLWWLIGFIPVGNFSLAFLYLFMIMAFAFVNGRVGTKRSALYTAAPVLYIGVVNFIFPLITSLNQPFVNALFDGLLGGILLGFIIGPVIGVRIALSLEPVGYDLKLTIFQILIFAVMQAAAFGLGYFWKTCSERRGKAC